MNLKRDEADVDLITSRRTQDQIMFARKIRGLTNPEGSQFSVFGYMCVSESVGLQEIHPNGRNFRQIS